MVAAARKHKRVVQVGTQRRSTPHLIEARDRVVKEGKLGKIGLVEIYCYYHMRARENPPDTDPPANLDYEFWTGPAPLRPYNKLVHPRVGGRSWSTATASSATCAFTCSTWSAGCSTSAGRSRISSAGGILVDKKSKANISDTQTATFDFGDLQVVWQHRTWGESADPKYPWGATLYGEKGTLKATCISTSSRRSGRSSRASTGKALYEEDKYPEDRTEKDLERHVASAIRGHMRDLLAAIGVARQAGGGHRAGAHLDGELHPGEPVDEAGPHAHLGFREAADRG